MDYSELLFYRKAQEATREVNGLIKSWRNNLQSQEISRQLFCAAAPVAANFAEGHSRHVGHEYIHIFQIAQGSANEVDHWLSAALDCQPGNDTLIQRIISLNNETRRMLASTIRILQGQQFEKRVRESESLYTPTPSSPDPYSSQNEIKPE